MNKELKAKILAYFKEKGVKGFCYHSGTGKGKWFGVYFPVLNPRAGIGWREPLKFASEFSADIRNKALDAIYGAQFERNRENPNAGNIAPHGMSMRSSDWLTFLDIVDVNDRAKYIN